MVRLIAAVRALTPPATALSTQAPPALPNWSAKTFTAADSPPEVHQWMTSALLSWACACPHIAASTAAMAVAILALMRFLLGSPVCAGRVIDYIGL